MTDVGPMLKKIRMQWCYIEIGMFYAMSITMISHSGLVVPYGIPGHDQILSLVQPQAINSLKV